MAGRGATNDHEMVPMSTMEVIVYVLPWVDKSNKRCLEWVYSGQIRSFVLHLSAVFIYVRVSLGMNTPFSYL